MVKYEYTKINKIYEVNNDMCHSFYYIYYGRMYNEEHTRYRKFKYIEWFDIFEVQEFLEKDYITKEDIREYALNIENHYLNRIKNYYDKEGLREFYDYCNETIKNYNNLIKF